MFFFSQSFSSVELGAHSSPLISGYNVVILEEAMIPKQMVLKEGICLKLNKLNRSGKDRFFGVHSKFVY